MNNFVIFIVGIAVTLIAGMGVITSQVFMGYTKFKPKIPEVEPDHVMDKSF
jgi:hypothetical protein